MEDRVDDLLLWGDHFEVILDILKGNEAVEQQFVATANNVSSNCANLRFKFRATDPKPLLVWPVTQIYETQKFNLNMHVLPAMTDQCFSRS